MKNPVGILVSYLKRVGGVSLPEWDEPLKEKTDDELFRLWGVAEHNRWFQTNNAVIAFSCGLVMTTFAAIAAISETGAEQVIAVIAGFLLGITGVVICLIIMVEVVAFNDGKIYQIKRILAQRNPTRT